VNLANVGARPVVSGSATLGADVFPTDGAWGDYVSSQGESLVRPVIRSIMQSVSSMTASTIPPHWQEELAMGQTVEQDACRAASAQITHDWVRPSPASTPEQLATLGRPAFDGVKAILVSLFQLAYASNPTADRRQRLAALGQRLHAIYRPADGALSESAVASSVEQAAVDPGKPSLVAVAKDLAERSTAASDVGTNDAVGMEAPAAPTGLPAAWELLQQLLAELVPELTAVTTTPPSTPTPAATTAIGKLRTYVAFLGDEPTRWRSRLVGLYVMERSMLPVGVDVEQMVQLIQVSATSRTLLDPARTTPGSKLTGMQFHHFGAFYKSSWRANDWMWGRLDGAGWLVHVLLDPRRVLTVVDADATQYPSGKRASAFFARLTEVAGPSADPTSPEAKAALDELGFLDRTDVPRDPPISLPATALWLAQSWQRAVVASELPVVAREALATPTRRDQQWAVDVLRQAGQAELAEAASRQAAAFVATGRSPRRAADLAGGGPAKSRPAAAPPATASSAAQPAAVESAAAQPASGPGTTNAASTRLLSETTAQLGALLRACPVPQETLGGQRGEPLFTRTVTKATAVATAAATAVEKPPATVDGIFRTARTTTLTGYRAANAVGFWPRRIIVGGAAVVVLGALLAAQSNAILGLSGVALVLAGLYLVALGVWSTSPRIFGALLAMTVVGLLFLLTIPATREFLFGTSDGSEAGWVTDHLVPWMRERWWALLLIVAVIIALPALSSYTAKRVADDRAKQRAKRPPT
jgi:hypothetical protein